jgi:DNA invertase Pin-like site-specific DNA recombinase
MKAAIYVRVSTDRQDGANQEPDCVRLATARGWEPVIVRETESGAKKRPEWGRVLELARRGQVAAVVIWSIDRMGRRMRDVVGDVAELDRVGCAVVSVCEPWLDTSAPTRDLLLAIFGWVAQHERQQLIERTRAGLERARAQGKQLGRPPTWVDLRRLEKMAAAGRSISRMSRRLGIARSTVRAYLAKMGASTSPALPQQPRQIEGAN